MNKIDKMEMAERLNKIKSSLFDLKKSLDGHVGDEGISYRIENFAKNCGFISEYFSGDAGEDVFIKEQIAEFLRDGRGLMMDVNSSVSLEDNVAVNVRVLVKKKLAEVEKYYSLISEGLIWFVEVGNRDYKNPAEEIGRMEGRLADLYRRVENIAESVNNLEDAKKDFDASKGALFEDTKKSLDGFLKFEHAAAAVLVEEAEKFINKKKSDIQAKSDDLDRVISLIASRALSGSFMQNAQKEEKAANLYRRYSLILMCGVGVFLLANFSIFEWASADTNVLINRLAAGLFFSFIVAYMIRQSAVHRAQQHQYMQKALDLNAITPYIATLPLEAQHAVKQLIAEKIFVPAAAQGSGDSSNFGVQEIVGKIIDKLELPKK